MAESITCRPFAIVPGATRKQADGQRRNLQRRAPGSEFQTFMVGGAKAGVAPCGHLPLHAKPEVGRGAKQLAIGRESHLVQRGRQLSVRARLQLTIGDVIVQPDRGQAKHVAECDPPAHLLVNAKSRAEPLGELPFQRPSLWIQAVLEANGARVNYRGIAI